MSQQLRIDLEVTGFDEADARAAKLEGDLAKAEKKLHANEMRAFTFAASVLHIGNLMANIVSRQFANTEAAQAAQDVSMGINIASTELGIARMLFEASAQATLNPWGAARLFATAGLMQINLAQQTQLQMQARREAANTKLLREQMTRWS